VADNDEAIMPERTGEANDVVGQLNDVVGFNCCGFVTTAVTALIGDGDLETCRHQLI
jgi:hypothetical protein